LLRFTGTSTLICKYRSPKPLPLSCGIPLSLSLNCFPDCVPEGILTLDREPSIVGTSIVVPRDASATEIGSSKYKFSSDLLKIG